MYVMLAEKLADCLPPSGLFGTAKAWEEPPGGAEMETEEELLMRAKTGAQRSCHLRHNARKCPPIHSSRKGSQSSRRDW